MELISKQNNALQLKYVCDNDAQVLTAAGYEHREELDRTDATGDLIETWSNAKFLECVFDIVYDIGYYAASGHFVADDSREAFQLAISWAREFQATFTPGMDAAGEYMERIEEFATEKIEKQ